MKISLIVFIFFLLGISSFLIILYINKKINSITLENVCSNDGTCSYSSKNSSFQVNNLNTQKIFTPEIDIIPKSEYTQPGKINFIEGELYCRSLGCGSF
jgi:hypothetical protein